MKSHDRRESYTCPICQASYISLPNIKAHTKDQHNNTCDTCKTVYSNVNRFIQHITSNVKICQRRKKRNPNTVIAAYPCNECKKGFPRKKLLANQKNIEHNFTSVKPTNFEELDKIIIFMMEKLGKPAKYSCKGCGKNTNNERNMISHIETNHIEGFAQPCKLCAKMLRSRESLRIHVVTSH